MAFDFIKFKEDQYLISVEIKEKETYHADIINIEESFTGRLDAWISNTFVQESVQLLINAINLFEIGYFDCAYYSLRQSLELSTTMVYLVDIEKGKGKIELSKWKNEERFPMQAQMLEFLSKNGDIFYDLKAKLNTYFEKLNETKSKLNKYVHKQGLDKFYVSRNHTANSAESTDTFISEFEHHLKSCIGAVAVFRLGIDPFPILLADEEMYHRTGDLMTVPYSTEFVNKYIGSDTIEKYKETEVYKGYYQSIIGDEKKQDCVTHLVKHQFIDIDRIEDILKQKHLISEMDLYSILICKSSDKVAKVYAMDGLLQYFTSRETVRTKMSWSSREFKEFNKLQKKENIPYDEAFISIIKIKAETYFIEHNEEFSNDELANIKLLT